MFERKDDGLTGAQRAADREMAKLKANRAFYAQTPDFGVESRQVQRARLRADLKQSTPYQRQRAVDEYRDRARAERDGVPY